MDVQTVTEQVVIKRKWFSSLPEITVSIECEPTATAGVKLGLAVKLAFRIGADLRGADLRGADLRGADLSSADLRGADLRGAVLRGADLSSADLRGADLRGAVLRGADLSSAVLSSADLSSADLSSAVLSSADLSSAPKIENIHQAVYAAASQPGALDMSSWHCGAAHCRAGWVVTLAGDEGKALEARVGTPAAATMIYLASDPKIDRLPNFYTDNATALADMARLAQAEAA